MHTHEKDCLIARAGAILRQMEDSYRSGASDVEPAVVCYNSVIDGYAKCKRKDAPDRAEEVFYGLLDFQSEYHLASTQPDAKLFTAVIDCWAKSDRREKADRADAILREMNDSGVDIDVFAYNSVLNVFATCGTMKAIKQAEGILEFLENHDTLKPDAYSYNSVLKGYSRMIQGRKA